MDIDEQQNYMIGAGAAAIPGGYLAHKASHGIINSGAKELESLFDRPDLIKVKRKLHKLAKDEGINVAVTRFMPGNSMAINKVQFNKNTPWYKKLLGRVVLGVNQNKDNIIINPVQADAVTAHEICHIRNGRAFYMPQRLNMKLYGRGHGVTAGISWKAFKTDPAARKVLAGIPLNMAAASYISNKLASGEKLDKKDYALIAATGLYDTLPELAMLVEEGRASARGMNILRKLSKDMKFKDRVKYLGGSAKALGNAYKTYLGSAGTGLAVTGAALGAGTLIGSLASKYYAIDDTRYYVLKEYGNVLKLITSFKNKSDALDYKLKHEDENFIINLGSTLKAKGYKNLDQLR